MLPSVRNEGAAASALSVSDETAGLMGKIGQAVRQVFS